MPQLDWNQAEVKDGKLSVAIAGEPPSEWKETFEQTARLLSRGQWDDVSVKKGRVRVDGLSPGSEEKLRHFLESVVQEANATHELTEEDDERESEQDASESDEDDGDEDEEPSSDAEMTERFRSFGQSGQS